LVVAALEIRMLVVLAQLAGSTPTSDQRQPSGIGDPHPDNLDRPLASMHGLGVAVASGQR
jgi:hypothetical protein